MVRKQLVVALAVYVLAPVASAVSLSQFQPFSAVRGATAACISSYQSDMPECIAADFADGAFCSDNCISAVLIKQLDLGSSCANVVTSKGSLLAIAFQGNLLTTLCPNGKRPKTTTSTAPTPTPSSTVAAVSPTRASSVSLAVPISTAVSTSRTTTALQTTTSVSVSAGTSLVIPTAASSSSASTSTSSQTSRAVAAPTPGQQLTVQQQQLLAQVYSGGGSPFDVNVVQRKAGSGTRLDLNEQLVVAVLVMFGCLLVGL